MQTDQSYKKLFTCVNLCDSHILISLKVFPFPVCDSAQSGVSEAGIWWDKFQNKQDILSQLWTSLTVK